MASPTDKQVTPFQKLLIMITEDRKEFAAILVYSFIQSILMLAIPLAAQALVNVVVGGLYLQPLAVLTGALFFGLFGAGVISIIRLYLVEVMRERIFVRVALRVTDYLPRVSYRFLSERNGPELMNRFFDVMNVQKSWTKIAFEGPGAVLDIVVGVLLLGVYGTELMGLSTALLVCGFLVICLAGYRGLKTSLAESSRKYEVVDWLEEMVHCQDALKYNSRPEYWLEEMDKRVVGYLRERRSHFRIIIRQKALYYAISAFALAGLLGAGGYLVLQGELTLGQLVAAELVIWSILKASQKIVELAESFFDLLTALEKVSYITAKMELDSPGAIEIGNGAKGIHLELRGVSFAYKPGHPSVLQDLNLDVKPGEVVTILGGSGSGRSTLIGLIAGSLKPVIGTVELDDIDVREISPDSVAHNVSVWSRQTDLFSGTLLDNISLGREVNLRECKTVLETYLSQAALGRLPEGLRSPMICGGRGLSGAEKAGILLTRTLVGKPRLLLLDESISTLSESQQRKLAQHLKEAGCTVVSTLPVPDLVASSDRVMILEQGKITADLSPAKLIESPPSLLTEKYPNLHASLKALLTRTPGEDS